MSNMSFVPVSSDLASQISPAPADTALVSLFGGNVYAIGGRIRDALVGYFHNRSVPEPKDLDYVITGFTLPEVVAKFEASGAKVNAVGASFAVLKVTIGGTAVDVALPRRERSTGPGHRDFAVDFGPEVSIVEDALRRDFTINALCLRLSDWHLIAPDGSLYDLRHGIVRAISEQSFDDDPLRMLRAAQFASRLGFEIEPRTFLQMASKASAITHCSPERIRDEFIKLLEKSERPSQGMTLLRDSGLLAHVIPELLEGVGFVQNRHHAFDVWDHVMAALDASAAKGDDLSTRVAVLLHDIGKPRTAAARPDGEGNTFYGHEAVGAVMAADILRRLRFSEDFVEGVRLAVSEHMFATRQSSGEELPDAAVRRFIRRVGLANVDRQFAVRYADIKGKGGDIGAALARNAAFEGRVRKLMRENAPISVRELSISGEDVIQILVERGIRPENYRGGREVGVILERLLETVIEDPRAGEREALLAKCADLANEIDVARASVAPAAR